MICHCCLCGKRIDGVKIVPNATRKNKRGRIAWARDSVCKECNEKLKERENNA